MFITPVLESKKYLFNIKILAVQTGQRCLIRKVKCNNIHRTQAVRTASDRNVLADKAEPVRPSTDKATQRPEGRPPQRHQDVHPAG